MNFLKLSSSFSSAKIWEHSEKLPNYDFGDSLEYAVARLKTNFFVFQYAAQSQINHHGLDVASNLILLRARKVEFSTSDPHVFFV